MPCGDSTRVLAWGAIEIVRRMSLASALIFLSLAAINYALKIPHQYSRISFASSLLFALILAPLFRFIVLSLARRWRWWGERCVILGTGPGGQENSAIATRSSIPRFPPSGGHYSA